MSWLEVYQRRFRVRSCLGWKYIREGGELDRVLLGNVPAKVES